MDFHSLSRRDLQVLCKKNRIPANMTNVAMADALQALQIVKGIEEIKEGAQFQSPVRTNVRSQNLPCTSRRTSARRAPVPDEPVGKQGSPLPRARRVAIKASEIMKLAYEGEEEKKEGPEEIPKTPAVRTGRKPRAAPSTQRNQRGSEEEEKEPQEEEQKQEDGPIEIPKTPAALTAGNTGRRASEKEETDGHEGPLEVAIAPATRYSRRASTRKRAEAPTGGEDKQEETVGFRSTRRTRQSTRKPMEETALDAVPDVGRRTTRAKAAVKMAALAQGEEEEKKDVATKDPTDQNNHPIEILAEKNDKVLMEEDVKKNGTIFDLYTRDSEPDDGVQDSSTEGNDDGTRQETNNSTPMRKNLGTDTEGEPILEEGGQQEDNVLSRLDETPIRGLVSLETNQWTNQEHEETEENPTVMDEGSEDERRGCDNLDFALPDPSLSNEISVNGEDSCHNLPETQAAGESPLIQENVVVELHGEIEANRYQIPEDLIRSKEEEASPNLLPIGKSLGETKVSGDELPLDNAPETETSTDLQANLEIEDASAKFPCEIPPAETNDSSDGFEIPEESDASMTAFGVVAMAPETEISIDLHSNLDTGDASAELHCQIPVAETDDSDDDVELREDTEESVAGILIGKQTAPEPESVLQIAASFRLQQSPSPSKILALDADHVGDLAESTVGSLAKTSSEVGDLIGCPLESRMESSAKAVGELGDPAGYFKNSDFGTGAPVATPPDRGSYESDGNGIVLEVKGGEEESVAVDIYMTGSGDGDDNKANRIGSMPSGLTLGEVGGGEAKPSQPDYNSLSMRKLKAMLREKACNL